MIFFCIFLQIQFNPRSKNQLDVEFAIVTLNLNTIAVCKNVTYI